MSVPKEKRSIARCEYVNQARIVRNLTTNLMRKWPKSRFKIDSQYALDAANEMFNAAVEAFSIYAVYPCEHERKLNALETAHSRLNSLVVRADDWYRDIPCTRSTKKQYAKMQPQSKKEAEVRQACQQSGEPIPDQYLHNKKVVSPERLKDYAGAISRALGVFTGAIKSQRAKYAKSVKDYPDFVCTKRDCSVPEKNSDIPSIKSDIDTKEKEVFQDQKLNNVYNKYNTD